MGCEITAIAPSAVERHRRNPNQVYCIYICTYVYLLVRKSNYLMSDSLSPFFPISLSHIHFNVN